MNKFNASAYKKKDVGESETFDVELPSGFTFTLRRPNLQKFAASGIFPSYLLDQMIEIERGGKLTQTSIEMMTAADITKTLDFLGALARAACVCPQIVDKPKNENEITFENLSDADFNFIMLWCRGAGGVEGENLSQFRQES